MIKLLRDIWHFVNRLRRNKYEKLLNRTLHSNGVKVLDNFHNAMLAIDCKYWLVFGSLLGAVRDKGFISNDTDIDVGVLIDNDFDKMDEALHKYGFSKVRKIEIYTTGSCQERGFELTYTQNNVLIDIFVFDKIADPNVIYTHTCLWDNAHFRYLSTVFRVVTSFNGVILYNFQGIQVYIPENYREVLQSYYGSNYEIPDPNWKPTMSPSVEVVKNAIGILDAYIEM